MDIPFIPLPEQVSGRIGLVAQFRSTNNADIRAHAATGLIPGARALLDTHPPHCTFMHATVRDASKGALSQGLEAVRALCADQHLNLRRTVMIGGHFQVLQDERPSPALQFAAVLSALILRPWLDRDAVAAAIQEGLTLTQGQQWCVRELGHPLVFPDVESGHFNRPLHVSFGYWENDAPPMYATTLTRPLICDIAAIRLAQMGNLGVVDAFFDI